MRKTQKDTAIEFTKLFKTAQEHMGSLLGRREYAPVLDLLSQCQQGAIQIGTMIEEAEGEGFVTVGLLEAYCEMIFCMYENVQSVMESRPDQTEESCDAMLSEMEHAVAQIEDSIKNDIKVRKEIVFLPYKASMWDSLESVWMAADADPECDAYVIPIPYYERDKQGNMSVMHYEADLFPDYVPVTRYDAYDFETIHPDMIFIHNPYDDANFVTSVHPFFYSYNIKKYTNMLIYVPYYATTGDMSEGQRSCSAYYYADYIVIQAEKYRTFFDSSLPKERLIAFGSPKFDRVIRICQNPPSPPEGWAQKMDGKRVFFFNTSIGGLLNGTAGFLWKMQYVFECFQKRQDACLIWRPHPLLESTLQSMRPQFLPFYRKLKEFFLQQEIGIYDETPDITDTIALCDAYVGDAGTSVTSLFGIAGKPLFILDNAIRTLPRKEDLPGHMIKALYPGQDPRYLVTQGNKLYYAPDADYRFRYLCDLSDYAYGDYYLFVVTIGKRQYVCPRNAQNILVMEHNRVIEKIPLVSKWEKPGAFGDALVYREYLILIPTWYPAVVKYNTKTKEIHYLSEHLSCYAAVTEQGEKRFGGYCIQDGILFLGSPIDNKLVAIDIETGETLLVTTQSKNQDGCVRMASDGENLWLLPYEGMTVTRWNPKTGQVREYPIEIEDYSCRHYVHGYACEIFPFSSVAFAGDQVYLAKGWGNKFVCLDRRTGQAQEWHVPFADPKEMESGYYKSIFSEHSRFLDSGSKPMLISFYDRRLYHLSLQEGTYTEQKIGFDEAELPAHEPGFCESSEWMQYACVEDYYNTLPDFLSGTVTGEAFDAGRQRRAFEKNAANSDGTCGEKLFAYLKGKLEEPDKSK